MRNDNRKLRAFFWISPQRGATWLEGKSREYSANMMGFLDYTRDMEADIQDTIRGLAGLYPGRTV